MKSPEDILAHLAYRIGEIYYHDRPLTYGATGAGVELLVETYHKLWAYAADRTDALEAAWRMALMKEDCGASNFSGRYALNNPEADCDEIAEYVLRQWRPITKKLGVPIPHEQLEQEFAEHVLVKKKQFNW